MEISASAASPAAKPPPLMLLLRPLAASSAAPATSSSSTTVRHRPSSSASATVRRRARARPRTGRRSEPPADGEYFSGDDGPGLGGGSGGSGGGDGWNWSRGFGAGSGQPDDWEPDVPAPRRSATEAALGVVYELMCLIALSNCTQFAVRRLAGLLAVRLTALRFVPTVC